MERIMRSPPWERLLFNRLYRNLIKERFPGQGAVADESFTIERSLENLTNVDLPPFERVMLNPTGKGRPLADVAVEAVDEGGNPTILATFTVIAAVFPMAFVSGLMGPYMRPMPIGASVAMVFSLMVAFVVSPWAALRALGYPPLILDFEAHRDTDHVVAIYKMNGHWGAIAKSNFAGCRWREPVHRTLRELAISYFDTYFNLRRQRSLRTYSRPVNLARFDRLHWMTAEKDIWFVAEHLCDIPHIRLLKPWMARRLSPADKRLYRAELTGHRWK